jgi:hypothetical protein
VIKLLFFYTDGLIKRNAHIFNYFPFGHRVVGSSSNYGFWLPLWYLQTLLNRITFVFTSFLFWINRTTYTLSEAGTVKKTQTYTWIFQSFLTFKKYQRNLTENREKSTTEPLWLHVRDYDFCRIFSVANL